MRRALLDAAMALFTERGIQRTRIEDITERTDLGKGAFYNYFDSKDSLVAELVRQAVDQLESEYLAQLREGSDLRVRVTRIVELHSAFFNERPHYVLLFHQARGLLQLEAKHASELKTVFSSYLRRIGERLAPANAGAAWTVEAKDDIAAVLVGAIAGYRSFRLSAGAEPSPATIASALTRGVPALLGDVAPPVRPSAKVRSR